MGYVICGGGSPACVWFEEKMEERAVRPATTAAPCLTRHPGPPPPCTCRLSLAPDAALPAGLWMPGLLQSATSLPSLLPGSLTPGVEQGRLRYGQLYFWPLWAGGGAIAIVLTGCWGILACRVNEARVHFGLPRLTTPGAGSLLQGAGSWGCSVVLGLGGRHQTGCKAVRAGAVALPCDCQLMSDATAQFTGLQLSWTR